MMQKPVTHKNAKLSDGGELDPKWDGYLKPLRFRKGDGDFSEREKYERGQWQGNLKFVI